MRTSIQILFVSPVLTATGQTPHTCFALNIGFIKWNRQPWRRIPIGKVLWKIVGRPRVCGAAGVHTLDLLWRMGQTIKRHWNSDSKNPSMCSTDWYFVRTSAAHCTQHDTFCSLFGVSDIDADCDEFIRERDNDGGLAIVMVNSNWCNVCVYVHGWRTMLANTNEFILQLTWLAQWNSIATKVSIAVFVVVVGVKKRVRSNKTRLEWREKRNIW